MPAARSQKGEETLASMANGHGESNGDSLRDKLASKKLDMLEQEHDTKVKSAGAKSYEETEEEVFLDTNTLGAHIVRPSKGHTDEPIGIFDIKSSAPIVHTVKDQFAAALLRLQSSLDKSTQRLGAIETRVDDIVARQRQQTRSNQDATAAAKNKWLSLSSAHLNTILYLSWPVLVFVAMRALEKRSLMKKLV